VLSHTWQKVYDNGELATVTVLCGGASEKEESHASEERQRAQLVHGPVTLLPRSVVPTHRLHRASKAL
jgi:hypothetical protein